MYVIWPSSCLFTTDSKNEKINATVRAKLKEFMPRAESLKNELEQQKNPSKISTTKDDKDKKKDPETEKLRQSLEDTIIKEKPNVSWSDVAGQVTMLLCC